MDLLSWLAEHHGVAHTSDLYRAGFSKHGIAGAVAQGLVTRIRRSWILGPGASEASTHAARFGGRVSCVTQAKALGLWTPDASVCHIAGPAKTAGTQDPAVRLHWAQGAAPFAPRAVAAPVINVLFHVARCQPASDALAIWESALRSKLIGVDVLQRIEWHSTRARRLARAAGALSDSGLETHFVELMRQIGVAVRQQVWLDGHPVDIVIGDRLVVQLDGFEHHSRAEQRRRDIRADARLALRGYTVLRFDYAQVMFEQAFVQETVRAAMAQGLHLAR